MRTNPHASAEKYATSEAARTLLKVGTVSSAPTNQTDGAHHVYVQEAGIPADDAIPVLPAVHGDYYIPPQGSPVVVSATEQHKYAVTNATIPEATTPTLVPGERILSHPLSKATVKFNQDGWLDIYGDPKVRINGGSQGIITDVSADSTNSQGGITSLDVTRDDNILI